MDTLPSDNQCVILIDPSKSPILVKFDRRKLPVDLYTHWLGALEYRGYRLRMIYSDYSAKNKINTVAIYLWRYLTKISLVLPDDGDTRISGPVCVFIEGTDMTRDIWAHMGHECQAKRERLIPYDLYAYLETLREIINNKNERDDTRAVATALLRDGVRYGDVIE